jgi:hypothetical protein
MLLSRPFSCFFFERMKLWPAESTIRLHVLESNGARHVEDISSVVRALLIQLILCQLSCPHTILHRLVYPYRHN